MFVSVAFDLPHFIFFKAKFHKTLTERVIKLYDENHMLIDQQAWNSSKDYKKTGTKSFKHSDKWYKLWTMPIHQVQQFL